MGTKVRELKKKLQAKVESEQQAKPSPEDENERAAREYVDSLLQGKTKPQNRFVGDLVQQMRQAQQELAQLAPQITDMENSLVHARNRQTALLAIAQQLGMNIYRWRDPPKEE